MKVIQLNEFQMVGEDWQVYMRSTTPFKRFFSTTPTLRPLEANAIAKKIPNVPPQTNISKERILLSSEYEGPEELGKV